jgi:hypothetical protein
MLLRNVGFQPGYTEVYLIRLNFSYSQLWVPHIPQILFIILIGKVEGKGKVVPVLNQLSTMP